MNKKKRKIVVISIVVTILIIIGVIFAYLFLLTDIFKSNKEVFFKYAAMIFDSKQGMIDNNMVEYFQKQRKTPFNHEGKFNFQLAYGDDIQEELKKQYELANNCNISFSGKVDIPNTKIEQAVQINYNDNVNFPVTFKYTGDVIGLQTKYVSKKYVALEKDKINEFISQASGEDNTSVSNNGNILENMPDVSNFNFSEQDLERLKNTYLQPIMNALEKDSFERVKDGNQTGYQLKLTAKDLKRIIITILQNLKQDQQTIDKLNELNTSGTKMTASQIENLIQEVQNESEEENQDFNLEIIIYVTNKEVSKIQVQDDEFKIELEKNKTGNGLQYNIVFEQMKEEEEPIKLMVNVSLAGIQSQNVTENYEVQIETPESDDGMPSKVQYNLSRNVEFVESIEVEDFTEENSMILNKYDTETVNNFINAVQERLGETNEKQMQEIGATMNPFLYMIPGFASFSASGDITQGSNGIDMSQMSASMSEAEVASFNNMFEKYAGTNIKGATLRGLFSTIQANNSSEEPKHLIEEINFKGEEYEANEQNITTIKDEIPTDTLYKVEFEKDEQGIVYRVVINEKSL